MRRYVRFIGAMAFALLTCAPASFAQAPPDAAQLRLQGRVTLTGSVALADLAAQWAQDFHRHWPGIAVTLGDAGGEAAIAALENGSADAVLLGSRPTPTQLAALRDRLGHEPTLIAVARDAVAVYVNAHNPLTRITLAQLDGLFSAAGRCAGTPLDHWSQLGVAGRGEVALYGLDAGTSANLLFRRVALCGGDFRAGFQALPGPAAVAAAIAGQPDAIGFSSSALRAPGIRALALARAANAPAVAPDAAAIRSQRYPMSRRLSIAVNVPPGAPLPPVLQAFVDYLRSAPGQQVARKAGYVPL